MVAGHQKLGLGQFVVLVGLAVFKYLVASLEGLLIGIINAVQFFQTNLFGGHFLGTDWIPIDILHHIRALIANRIARLIAGKA